MIKTVDFWSRHQVEHYNFPIIENNWALISITDPSTESAKIIGSIERKNILQLQFHDIDGNYTRNHDYDYMAMNSEKGQSIRNFVHELYDAEEPYNLIVHCEAGISRSYTVAKWVHDEYFIPWAEPDMREGIENTWITGILNEVNAITKETSMFNDDNPNDDPYDEWVDGIWDERDFDWGPEGEFNHYYNDYADMPDPFDEVKGG